MIQVLKEFENRTEYKILNNYSPYEVKPVNDLYIGVLVIPGVCLTKLQQEKLYKLNQWIENSRNQLIIVPNWTEMNVQTYFNASVPIEIQSSNSHYNSIPVNYQIHSSVKEVIFEQNSQIFGINYRRNTGSGLITIVTLPLLDYKLSEYENINKNLFHELLLAQADEIADINKKDDEFKLDDIHAYLLLLVASDVNLEGGIGIRVRKYFTIDASEDTLKLKYNELLNNNYICEGKISDRGINYIKQKNLKAFIRVIKERELRSDEWR